jgi:hypothetical protein
MPCVGQLGNGIIPARAERVATSDPSYCQPRTAHRAMLADRFDRIRGATRKITTGRRQKLAEAHLITPNGENEERSHALTLRAASWPRRILVAAIVDWASDHAREPHAKRIHLVLQLVVRRSISIGKRPHNDVHSHPRTDRAHDTEHMAADQLSQASLQPIAIYRRMSVLGNDKADPTDLPSGRYHSHIQILRAKPLSITPDGAEIRAAC